MPLFKAQRLTLVALLWPLLAAAFALASPGPGEVPRANQQGSGRARAAVPPSDERGSTMFVSGERGEGEASMFWQTPSRVQVRMIVEIPPPADTEPEAAEPVPESAAESKP